MSVEPCDRLPCDWAYRGQTHALSDRGFIVHAVSVASGEVNGQRWRVEVIAVDESTWTVRLTLPVVIVDGEPDEVHELGQAVTRAAMRAATFNLTDLRRDFPAAWKVGGDA